MTNDDDRPWKAEDLLRSIVEAPDAESTRARIEQYFDELVAQGEEMRTVSIALDAPGTPHAMARRSDAHVTESLPTKPPTDVPNHTLIRCLGAGGFGQVWLARHALTQHWRACKLVPEHMALELEGLRRLKRRVPAHPSLFPIEDVGVAGEWLYCLMPLADNASTDQAVLDDSGYEPLTLAVHLQRHGRRPTAEAAAIGLDIAEALRVLHEHGVTHGDVKPGNIMRLNGRWTLADYGLARDLSAPAGDGHTPGYTPPEGPGSTEADRYALGVVLMELLTGWPARMLHSFRETPVERFKLDDAGPRLAEIIRNATASDPAQRLGSIEELIAALRPLAPGAQEVPLGRPRRRLPLLAAAVLGVAVVVAIAMLLDNLRVPVPSPQVAPASLTIESFEVRRYHDDGVTLVPLGPIGAGGVAARSEGDLVTVHARFSKPAHFYLLSLDTDGAVNLRLPESPLVAPAATDRVDYPSLPVGAEGELLYDFTRGPGAQGFLVLASPDPLPPWSEWIADRGMPAWTPDALPPNAAVLFDGSELRTLSATRDPVPRRGRLALEPIDWAKAQEDMISVFIAFPVLGSEN